MATEENLTMEVVDIQGGKITFAPDVIATIATLAANEVEGIEGMSGTMVEGITGMLNKKSLTKGIKVELNENNVTLDLNVVVKYGYRIHEVSSNLQRTIRNTIQNMTGLNVPAVNVFVQSVAFEKDKDIEILDAAVSGFKTIDLMTNFVPLVTDFKPDIVHIMIGTNDMKRTTDAAAAILIPPEEYRRELCYLVDRLKNDGARIVLSTLPPFDPDKIYASFNAVNVQYVEADRTAYNGVVREVAAEYDCILNEMEDVYKKHESAQITEADGLHLNLDGQRMLACGVLESLMDAAGSI